MDLYNFVRKETGFDIKTNIEYTGMTDSTRPSTLSFLDNPKFAGDLCNNKNIVSAFVRRKDISFLPEDVEPIIAENPKAVFFELHNDYCRKYMKHEASIISESAMIHPSAFVASEGVIIGDNVIVGPNCSILTGVKISNKTTIGPNCVIGAEGFHVFVDTQGVKRMVIHDGWVIVGENVDMQASVTVDKGLMGRDTVIGDECKLDNLVHIAHRVHLGKSISLASGACVAGSVNVGDNVWVGPGSILSNRVSIGDEARILIGSVVIRNVKPKENVSGNFAQEHKKHILSQCS